MRFEVAKKIVHRAADHGIAASDVVVDPLVMPIGAINQAGVTDDWQIQVNRAIASNVCNLKPADNGKCLEP